MRTLLGLLLCICASPALAQPSLSDLMPNFVGAGVGIAPEHAGSGSSTWGVAPAARVSLGGERFVALTGPFAEANLLDHRVFQAGPVVNLRLGRSDAPDRGVRALGTLDPLVEMGGRLSVSWLHVGTVPFRARAGVAVMGDATGRTSGVSIVPSASLWVPLSPRVFVGAGVAARFGSASQHRYFFGVSEAGAAVSGLPAFAPRAGLSHVTAWPAVVWRLDERWAVGAGLAYTRLSDEVSGSPVVRRGSRDQVVAGVGIAYTW